MAAEWPKTGQFLNRVSECFEISSPGLKPCFLSCVPVFPSVVTVLEDALPCAKDIVIESIA